ncbi:50S ribosomal protein L18e [Candidatus Micrarchaeota archaeon]|nr:50S ribosomal protein L18e [Candidatus Micrarchaeota archaeon]
MKRLNKSNQILLALIQELMKNKKPFWRKVANELSRPRRKKVEVNLSKIDTYGADDSTVLVPGKVLGTGSLSKKMTIAAFSFSESAKRMIGEAGCKAVSIESLHKDNPEGRNVAILK